VQKWQAILTTEATDLTGKFSVIKPLCSTQWLCRETVLQRTIDQQEAILLSLEELSSTGTVAVSEVGTKARGLLVWFQDRQCAWAVGP